MLFFRTTEETGEMIRCTLVSHVLSALHWSSVASDFKMFTEAISCAIVLVWHQFEKLQQCANRFFMKEVGTFLFIFSELILFQGLPVPNIMPQQLITCHFLFLLYFGVKICRRATSYIYIYTHTKQWCVCDCWPDCYNVCT